MLFKFKRHAKISFGVLFLLVCMLLAALPAVADSAVLPSVSAKSAVLMEAESGNIVWSHAADLRLPMASTTKIMTALTALTLEKPETVITVDAEAVGVEGSSIYLVEGEQQTLENLLYALLLESANDAAAAIAIGISGSISAFADEMNRLAVEIGLENTHFENPHGLDSETHYTTAHDLARITREALQNEAFRTMVGTRKTTIPHPSISGTRLLVNHNKLLRMYEGCIGVKTGFTKHSGRCLVSAAERDGVTLIAVTLNAPDDWRDHTSMLDYGFTQYRLVLLCRSEEQRLMLPVVGGTESDVLLTNAEDVYITLPIGHGPVEVTIEAPRFLYAGITAGEAYGRILFCCDANQDGIAETVAEAPLYAAYSIERIVPKKSFWQWLKALFHQ